VSGCHLTGELLFFAKADLPAIEIHIWLTAAFRLLPDCHYIRISLKKFKAQWSLFGEDSFIVVGDGLKSNSQPEYSTIITMQQLMNSEIFANVPA
jgi:hypothetical protein